MDICFATNNAHKLEEVRALVTITGNGPSNSLRIISLAEVGCREELAEEQNSLEGNSRQKAEYVFQKYKVACFADDSGLEVDELSGAPGVDSAHYAGPQRSWQDNMDLLLKNLHGKKNRRAQFRTVITLLQPNGQHVFEGIVKGTILEERRGQSGFGYDPLFLPDGFSKTLAEMSMDEKNQISHRAKATRKLVEFLTHE